MRQAKQDIVAVLGAGSWGTALAFLASHNGLTTRLWARSAEVASSLTQAQENVKYLPGASLQNVVVNADLEAVLQDAAWVVAAVPCNAVPALATTLQTKLPSQAIVISGTKGLHSESGLRPAQLWAQRAALPPERYVALSGPNLAKEIIAGVPTSTVVASQAAGAAAAAQQLFSTPSFRVYTNTDLIGVELGGALKNVVAIAAGICDGLGFGDNSKAALITRAWREMTRLAVALGAQEGTLFGLSGIGDLFATCASPHSRNRTLGCYLASGESLKEAQHDVAQVAEGVHTTRAALRLSQETGIELPITEQVGAILFEGRDPRVAVTELMRRQGCSE
ncbi:MAG: NAD(P)-dependent glycerol-3-phosphate dehydrogenase [Abitibacteriaceae bacterium]|nr:NAD(P)-dependent glycerol-3-phosphate dehydrogenase [Abditibacteriaceae bacterium]MBV9868350.1 NAD(P)-dependent glycerol-3-phosphate dehydrogenase [Abditibacteriaceae bacterium]